MRSFFPKYVADILLPLLAGTVDPLLGLAYPRFCIICESRIESHRFGSACRKCWAANHYFSNDDPLCFKCGKMMTGNNASSELDCHQCSEHCYDNAVAVGTYTGAIKQAILKLKTVPNIPEHLNELIEKRLQKLENSQIDLVIPIPLSERRYHERGFNQAELVADRVGRILDVKVDHLSLARVKHSPMHRAGMDRKAREKTVFKAFAVKRPRLIGGKRILLVDDVLTSGSTASACAKELKANGAVSVGLFTIGRA